MAKMPSDDKYLKDTIGSKQRKGKIAAMLGVTFGKHKRRKPLPAAEFPKVSSY